MKVDVTEHNHQNTKV